MTDSEQREAARKFANKWKNGGDEMKDSHKFWLGLLGDVLGVDNVLDYIDFEKSVKVPEGDGKIHSRRIDGYIPAVKVLIEQKGSTHPLDEKESQSGGELLTPYEQGKRYNDNLPFSERARWIVTCNFKEIWIYDLEMAVPEPRKIEVVDLQTKYPVLDFLVKREVKQLSHEMEVSIKAGDIVGLIYDAFLKQYGIPETAPRGETAEQKAKREHKLKSLNALCVRLVFLFYAEDAGIFERNQFHDYLAEFPASMCKNALARLFHTLDQKPEDRDEYLEPNLANFPYVNGGLFSDENIVIPPITDEIKTLLVDKASGGFDWRDISPTIFGAVFESTLNPETRRKSGAHFTSIENIHKVIDPLFLDDLKQELSNIEKIKVNKIRIDRLDAFRHKLASLTFLDPACGSGNFLTETYLSLRRMENHIIQEEVNLGKGQVKGQMSFGGTVYPIEVSIQQFYGIEYNDFAVTVAKTALWIAESQMLEETKSIEVLNVNFLPLKTYVNIVEGNALRIDWEKVVPKEKLSYIMGNPPFVGAQLRSKKQTDDMNLIFGKGAPETKLDYVSCWYMKAVEFIKDRPAGAIQVAFVSTNSICQGESVPTFWKRMADEGAEIRFAYRSFKWKSESAHSAAVICVIVGFTYGSTELPKYIYEDESRIQVNHINGYLQNAPDVWIVSRKNISPKGYPKMIKGSEPSDGGNLFLTPEEQETVVSKYPQVRQYIRPFVGGDEYLNNLPGEYTRYCIWLEGGNPADCLKIKDFVQRFKNVAEKRKKSSADRIRKRADYPYLFCQIRQPDSDYLLFPRHSSGERRYLPIGFMPAEVIAGDACYIIPDTTLELFSILISNVHMAWMRVVCGRIKSDYRYSPAVYNNFPWPVLTEELRDSLKKTGQDILNARSLFPGNSLADLYDPLTMPPELRKAHTANDIAVMKAYGFSTKMSEADCVAALMRMYQELAEKTCNGQRQPS